jgi:DNA repair protein RecN (Recombination protein N)
MLTTLRIKNLALVADLTLGLQPGCNAITGETGAGKSIIIGALNLVLGERSDRTLIRAGADACSVEAVFDVTKLKFSLKEFLEENGLEPCEAGQLVVKRTFTSAGTNRQFINGSPTTLATLATLGESLVDMHGPHDHQSLLHPARQLEILDAFGATEGLRADFAVLVKKLGEVETQKAALIVDEKTYAQQIDLLRFQANEIATARLQSGEEEALGDEYNRASNAAKILQLCQSSLGLLSEDEQSIMALAGSLGRQLAELKRIDPSAGCVLSLHEQATQSLRDVLMDLRGYADGIDLDPERLAILEERLNVIHTLKRKYGGTVDDVIAFGEEASAKLQALEQRDAELARLNAELGKLRKELSALGQKLSAERQKVIPKLAKAAVRQLSDLGFKQSYFDVALTSQPLPTEGTIPSSGLDAVEFQFAPNPGEPPRPLRAIASSGEMARVMLALKTVLAAQDAIPVLVFDEVDANVGGETASVVGDKMRQIAERRQVLCITHLPAVAAAANAHYVVSKSVKEGRTISDISLLSKPERVTELARMLGGQSEAARKHAEALLKASS